MRGRALVAAATAAILSMCLASTAAAIDKVDTKKLRKGVTVRGIMEHERAFQRIAIAHDNNRAAATPGYDASVDYVVNRMRKAGYRVRLSEFDFPAWVQNGPATLERTAPDPATFAEGTDYLVTQFSGAGDVTAKIVPTNDIVVPPPGGAGSGTSGCEATDFPAETAGNIALMQRGTCPFVQKFENAKTAGAVAALVFNDGGEGREEPIPIASVPNIGIPTLMTSNDVGEELLNGGGPTVHVVVDATTTPRAQYNVIADSKWGDKDRTIVVGAHLDSVEEGPGINDNGSGTSTDIEVAEQIAKLKQKPRNRIRFAFWGAEEAGLIGSTAYVRQLVANGKISQIEANLNFDMLGSPNFVRFVYDGDNSGGEGAVGPPGSAEIEQVFLKYFRSQGLVTDPTAFDGRSDYGEFIANGVPAGGLFSGAEGIKTERQESIYGGFAGMPFDECYHQACDSIFNLNRTSLNQMSDAVAHSTWTLVRSKSPLVGGKATKKSKKAKRAKRAAKRLKYRGQFRTR